MTTLGLLGMLLVLTADIPQILKVWKSKETAGISLFRYGILLSGLICFLGHAVWIEDTVFIVNGIIGCFITGGTLTFILFVRRKENGK